MQLHAFSDCLSVLKYGLSPDISLYKHGRNTSTQPFESKNTTNQNYTSPVYTITGEHRTSYMPYRYTWSAVGDAKQWSRGLTELVAMNLVGHYCFTIYIIVSPKIPVDPVYIKSEGKIRNVSELFRTDDIVRHIGNYTMRSGLIHLS